MNEPHSGTLSVDAYIAGHSEEIAARLTQIRRIVREETAEAQEKISYGMPTFTLNGNLVHYATFKNHIGFYPTPSGIEGFAAELSNYPNAKGSVQFPYDRPLPEELIRRIVRFRIEENRKAQPVAKKRPSASKQKQHEE